MSDQLDLFTDQRERLPREVELLLGDGFRYPLKITFTKNRVSLLSAKFNPDHSVELRMHRAFLSAPDEVLLAVRTYIRSRRSSAWNVIQDFVSFTDVDEHVMRRPRVKKTKGRHFDLKNIRDRVNKQYFNGSLKCDIMWGRKAKRRRRARSRSIVFGTYHKNEDLVRVNPILDDKRVPPEFMDYIVFHEMLHAAVPSVRKKGRTRHHSASFRLLEKRFSDLVRMRKIAKELLHVLE